MAAVDEPLALSQAEKRDAAADQRMSAERVRQSGEEHSPSLEKKVSQDHDVEDGEADDYPTEEERGTLRRLPDRISITSFLIAVVEMAERFSYYGSQVVYQNFVDFPLPPGSKTGKGGANGQAGALGRGQRAATAINTLNTFWVYTIPLLGAYIADTRWGRWKTIIFAVSVAIVGHVLLVISGSPVVLKNPNSGMGVFILAVLIMGFGTGMFKSNISPLVAEQSKNKRMRVVTQKSGERVILDPAVTSARIYMYFYLFINVGALGGQLGMSFAEKYVGYWLAFSLPTILFMLCPIVLFAGRNRYVKTPPEGSVLADALKLWTYAAKGRFSWNPVTCAKQMTAADFWTAARPSEVEKREGKRPGWMTWNDEWVMEVRRGLKACQVFLFLPIWWLSYVQMTNNLISQAGSMQTHGIPNEVVSNLDPLALIILIPITEQLLFPALRKAHIRVTPVRKIFMGFMTGAVAMVVAAIIQMYIYRKSACGKAASTCKDADGNALVAPINVWVQSPAYILIAISEILASVTSLEYAFTKAPKNMRSIVMAIGLFMQAISAAIAEGLVVLSEDPWLIWNYGVVAILCGVFGFLFLICFHHLDLEEERLNELPSGTAHETD